MEDKIQFFKTQQPKPGSPEALLVGTYPYRELIRTLWISNGTRSDIAFAGNTLTKFAHNHGMIHWRAAMRVLGYLNTGMIYCKRYAQQTATDVIIPRDHMRGVLPMATDFNCYVDASRASDIDT